MEKEELSFDDLLKEIKRKTIEQHDLCVRLLAELKRCRAHLCFQCGNQIKEETRHICEDCHYRNNGPWISNVEGANNE